MKRLVGRWLVVVLALSTLVVVGCGGGDDNKANGGSSSGGTQAVNLTQGSDLTFAMVTHSDEGSFWSVVKKGAEQAAKDEGIKLIWSPSNNDPQKEAQLIDAAVSQKVDGLAVSVPNADAIKDSLAKAKDQGIPIITLNSVPSSSRTSAPSRTWARTSRSRARRPAIASSPRAPRRCSASSTSRTTSASSSAATASSRASAAT